MKVILVQPKKHPAVKEIAGTLKEMQEIVGGYIQAIYLPDDVALICNEEGKYMGLPLNRALRDEAGNIVDIVAGDFLLCYAPPEAENFQSMPPRLIDKYMRVFRKIELFV